MPEINRISASYPDLTTPSTTQNGKGQPVRGHSTETGSAGANFGEMLRVRQGIAPAEAQRVSAALAASGLRFSAHAQTRLQSRQIALEAGHLERLSGAVQKAASKGSRDALVLMDDIAMVVSVKNRTVVTVVDRDHIRDNVFTNIDSAVIA